ncbi:hypothetical protein P153DRAFT_366639 [Dothidotthia symphoricarpi CBS 119687]|uniref:Uncharacterized protein n=1 Tax=Dothidotthia symphoricarpi CBS 119687 TaxID=1392245 RepID=A0A6A6AC92_9PLEO|nr:uncharacterized protein P153DRAFT_366639 [Dothidotthia symphoricarpi CBS 119687]KAF2129206.1 hypothetical protein P153DRAFT_366639 [Dothidotthia symphoricarpi CBS 119687]
MDDKSISFFDVTRSSVSFYMFLISLQSTLIVSACNNLASLAISPQLYIICKRLCALFARQSSRQSTVT